MELEPHPLRVAAEQAQRDTQTAILAKYGSGPEHDRARQEGRLDAEMARLWARRRDAEAAWEAAGRPVFAWPDPDAKPEPVPVDSQRIDPAEPTHPLLAAYWEAERKLSTALHRTGYPASGFLPAKVQWLKDDAHRKLQLWLESGSPVRPGQEKPRAVHPLRQAVLDAEFRAAETQKLADHGGSSHDLLMAQLDHAAALQAFRAAGCPELEGD